MANVLKADRKTFLARVRSGLKRSGLDALLVSSECGIKYLGGYFCPGALLAIPKAGSPYYLVDSMNSGLASRVLKGVPFRMVTAPGDKMQALCGVIKKLGIRKLGFEEDALTVSAHDRVRVSLKGVRTLPAARILRDARLLKTCGEIKLIRKAAAETMGIWRSTARKIEPGMSERRIAAMIDAAIHSKGYANSFETIVASGPNSAYPHAVPTDRVLKKGEHLVVDFGLRLDGYCSDLTRVWGEGRIVRKIGLLQKHVRTIHDRIIHNIRPGVDVGTLAGEADKYFNDNGLGQYACHALGHGVGIEVHEGPSLSSRAAGCRLKAGMVITVEPGLYIPGAGGVRVEDMVLVTKNGCEVLTK